MTGASSSFEGFHHFKPAQAQAILQDAVEQRAAIGVFEASLKPPLVLTYLLGYPATALLSEASGKR